MERKRNFESKLEKFLTGKGFYIVLFLCIAVIGVSAWIMLFSDDEPEEIGTSAVFNADEDENLDAIAEKPALPEKTEKPAEQEEPEMPVKPETPEKKPAPVQTVVSEPEEKPVEKEPAETVSAPTAFVWPVNGKVIGEHSLDALVYNKTMEDWRTHCGIDISAELGEKVRAVTDGTVTKVYDDDMFGTTVVIDHGAGVSSLYSNMAAKPTVQVGDKVSLGDTIGSVGTTALAETCEVHHLHFEMTENAASVDPMEYMPLKLG